MLRRNSISGLALAGALLTMVAGAQAFDETRYPDLSGQWIKRQGIGNQWDQTKPSGRALQPPLTVEYQKIFEASLADQAAGGQGGDTRITCVSTGMPRMMVRPFEFVITPNVTYINFENNRAASTPTAAASPRTRRPLGPAIRSANGSTPTTTAASIRSKSRPVTLRAPASQRQRVDHPRAYRARRREQGRAALRDHHRRPRADQALDGVEDFSARTQCPVVRGSVQRKQQSRRRRQSILLPLRRRLPDADS
jgi:hypothetical protein